jgi:serine/threonine protein kinase/tetratricopeptide (TPR) repeat protein
MADRQGLDPQGNPGEFLIMDVEAQQRILALLDRALDWPEAEREARLRDQLRDEPEVLQEVLKLLEADKASAWLPTQPPEPVTASEEAPMPARIGQYRIIEEIGRGGMGLVYRAERDDGLFEQQVAIKVIKSTVFSASAQEQFAIERRILAKLHHPHIAQLLDGGVDESGASYIIMELIHGMPITDYVETRGLDIQQRLDLFLQACDALEYAHRSLVVHADVKPSNVVVAEGFGVKLLDFGIARLTNEEGRGHSAHTPGYSSPARQSGERSTPVDDIFALGVLLGHLLEGVPGVTPDLTAIVRMAAAEDASIRYGAISELTDDIGRWRQHRPVRARPGDRRYDLYLFWRRHRLWLTASLTAAIVLTTTAILTSTLYVRAERERVAAEQRFTEIRRLSDFLLSDAISDLEAMPGSGPLRQRLAENAYNALSRLTKVPGAPVEVQVETAKGLSRVGEILAAEDLRDVMDPATGDKILHQAESSLRQLSARLPRREDVQLALARTLVARSVFHGVARVDNRKALALVREANGLLDPLISRNPETLDAQFLRLETDTLSGYIAADESDYATSKAVLQSAIARARSLHPVSARQKVEVALKLERALTLMGDAWWYTDNKPAALASYQAGMDEISKPGLPPDIRISKRLAYDAYTVASSNFELGDANKALRIAEEGVRRMEQARLFDDSASARRMENIIREEYGLELQNVGRIPEAIVQSELSLEGYRQSARLQPNNYQAQRSLPAALRPTGELYRDTGNRAKACAMFREADAIWARLEKTHGVTQFDRDNDIAQIKSRLAKCS